MKVSIVIPTYNRAMYLRQALHSALGQTMTDLEVIVVDDGSTDETPEIVRQAAEGAPVRYMRTAHAGMAHARNIGMRMARGEYIAFLDSDDQYYPYKLELQVRLLDTHPDIQMVYTECSSFDDGGDRERFHLRTYHCAYRDPRLTYDHIFQSSVDLASAGLLEAAQWSGEYGARRAYFGKIFDVYLSNVIVFHNSSVFRRRLLQEVGYFDECLEFFVEMDFLLRICRRHAVAFIDVPTYKLRYHPGQMSTTAGPDGTYTAVRKQHCLLRVFRRHVNADSVYYERHRTDLDRQLARLHRAVAIPLLCCEPGTASTREGFPRRARAFLAGCSTLGHPEPLLWALTYMPPVIRRVSFAALRRVERLRRRLRGRLLTDRHTTTRRAFRAALAGAVNPEQQ